MTIQIRPGELKKSVREFKMLVRAFHTAGLEVILDVVYNHTAEGNHLGPTLSFRGIDNAAYYRLMPDHPRYYFSRLDLFTIRNKRLELLLRVECQKHFLGGFETRNDHVLTRDETSSSARVAGDD